MKLYKSALNFCFYYYWSQNRTNGVRNKQCHIFFFNLRHITILYSLYLQYLVYDIFELNGHIYIIVLILLEFQTFSHKIYWKYFIRIQGENIIISGSNSYHCSLGPIKIIQPRHFFFIELPVPIQECERSCICVLAVLISFCDFFYWILKLFRECCISFSSFYHKPPRYSRNIVESGIKHHNFNTAHKLNRTYYKTQ